MQRYGLIGKHIQHSKSPAIHQFMANKLGIKIKYELFDIESQEIPTLLKLMRKRAIHGLNVTIPYKKLVINYVDRLTPKAKKVGAVNTLYIDGDELVGDNTDYDGFYGMLQRNKIQVYQKSVYILGSGGAAKAAYSVLKDLGAFVKVVNRSTVNIDPSMVPAITYSMIHPEHVDIYIQATPIGGRNYLNQSVLDERFVQNKTVIDLIYDPPITPIMSYAKEAYGGLDILILQALRAEEIWFDLKIEVTPQLIQEIKDVIMHE